MLSCSFPKEPAGGEVSVTHLHPGGEAYFRCLTGYRLQGMKMLTCRNATTPYWSGKVPRCLGKFLFKIFFMISSQCWHSETTMVSRFASSVLFTVCPRWLKYCCSVLIVLQLKFNSLNYLKTQKDLLSRTGLLINEKLTLAPFLES